MEYVHNPALSPLAKKLRKNMTKEERHLWYDFLSTYPVRFLRQRVFGRYIVDFYCAKARLVIEIDGSQHFEPSEIAKDAERTGYLESLGLSVYRIANIDINQNFRGVCEYIDMLVKSRLS